MKNLIKVCAKVKPRFLKPYRTNHRILGQASDVFEATT